MASGEIDPQPHKYWPSVESWKAFGQKTYRRHYYLSTLPNHLYCTLIIDLEFHSAHDRSRVKYRNTKLGWVSCLLNTIIKTSQFNDNSKKKILVPRSILLHRKNLIQLNSTYFWQSTFFALNRKKYLIKDKQWPSIQRVLDHSNNIWKGNSELYPTLRMKSK